MHPSPTKTLRRLHLGGIALFLLLACNRNDDNFLPGPAGRPIFAVDTSNRLISFGALRPSVLLSSVPITGMQPGEDLVALDFRPANAQLVGLGSTSRLYLLDRVTGVATPIGSAAFGTPLSGSKFGIDFNPTVDRLRIHSNSGQNLRANPDTGALAAVDAPLAYAAGDPHAGAQPYIAENAYTNSFAGATTTTLFAIDSSVDALVMVNPPNAGTLITVGALGLDTSGLVGFDIAGNDGTAYATFTANTGGASLLHTLDLGTGRATLVGAVGNAQPLRSIAVLPQ